MELLAETGQVKAGLLSDLTREADEILSMTVASIKTSRSRKESEIRNPQSAIGSDIGHAARR
jgi:hypothetical protein